MSKFQRAKSVRILPPTVKFTSKTQTMEENWKTIQCGLEAIYEEKNSEISYELLHRSTYHLVIGKKGKELYDNLMESVTKQVQRMALPLLYPDPSYVSTGDDFSILTTYSKFKTSSLLLSTALSYLNNYLSKENHCTVIEGALRLFRKVVIEAEPGVLIKRDFLNSLNKESIAYDNALVQQISSMLTDLGCYDEMEDDILKVKIQNFRERNQIHLSRQYFREAARFYQNELRRAFSFLRLSTIDKLHALFRQIVVKDRLITDQETCFSILLEIIEEKKYDELERFYPLIFDDKESLSCLSSRLGEYIVRRGTEYVLDEHNLSDPNTFIRGRARHKFE